jgi:hypothetical protein
VDAAERFARRVFTGAGILGLAALVPHYLLEGTVGRMFPPAITHPEYFYGFVGVAVAWQLAFLVMAREPLRYRGLMPVAVVEKASFGIPTLVLILLARAPLALLPFAVIDLTLGTLFLVAFFRTRPPE